MPRSKGPSSHSYQSVAVSTVSDTPGDRDPDSSSTLVEADDVSGRKPSDGDNASVAGLDNQPDETRTSAGAEQSAGGHSKYIQIAGEALLSASGGAEDAVGDEIEELLGISHSIGRPDGGAVQPQWLPAAGNISDKGVALRILMKTQMNSFTILRVSFYCIR
jgi:hypothetical protein